MTTKKNNPINYLSFFKHKHKILADQYVTPLQFWTAKELLIEKLRKSHNNRISTSNVTIKLENGSLKFYQKGKGESNNE
jgi:hypothetical protein